MSDIVYYYDKPMPFQAMDKMFKDIYKKRFSYQSVLFLYRQMQMIPGVLTFQLYEDQERMQDSFIYNPTTKTAIFYLIASNHSKFRKH